MPAEPSGDEIRERVDALLADRDPPMAIVTARASDGRIAGCLVGFSTQCSITPPKYAVWLSIKNHTYEVARDSTHLAVHILGADQISLAEHFGSLTGHQIDKFADRAWSAGPGGVPVLAEARGWFGGPAEQHPPNGDHALFVITPDAAEGRLDGPPLSYQAVRDVEPGNPA
jgi:flavin reductase (DIM6/NTAB) family NADH-FMN oxidoreductase RutF